MRMAMLRICAFVIALASPAFAASPTVDARALFTSVIATIAYNYTLPTCAAGKLLLIAVGYDNQTVDDSWPGGWNLLVSGNTAAGLGRGVIRWRVATGAEAGIVAVTKGSNTRSAAASFCIAGFDSSTPFAANPTGTTTLDPPATTTLTSKDYLAIAVAVGNRGFTITGYPSGYSNGQTQSVGTAFGTVVGTAELRSTATSYNPGVFSGGGDADGWYMATLVVNPPAAVAAKRWIITGGQ